MPARSPGLELYEIAIEQRICFDIPVGETSYHIVEVEHLRTPDVKLYATREELFEAENAAMLAFKKREFAKWKGSK